MSEATETQTWLEFALACEYIPHDIFTALDEKYEVIINKINNMDIKAESFCFTKNKK